MDQLQDGVYWCGEFEPPLEVHYCTAIKTLDPVDGPMSIYYPLSGDTWTNRFIPCPGLEDRISPDFDPREGR